MYDINPLGSKFHLKELERQAAPRLRSLQPKRDILGTSALSAVVVALLGYFGVR